MELLGKNYLKVEALSKRFGDVCILSDISFSVAKGEFVCIVGSSGCGKSTLLRSLSGLDTAYEGRITVDDQEVKKPTKHIGYIFQENRLFPWMTVEENVGFSLDSGTREEKRRKVSEAVAMVGLKEAVRQYPKTLSGGMAQRANIARTLVNKPEVLLLDEPFGALDAFTKINLQEKLCEIRSAEKTTMIMVTHDIEEAIYLADRIIILDKNPGVIKKIIKVDLPRPRDRNGNYFNDLRKEIYGYFFETKEIVEDYNI
ncbi:ABC transporter ATP-binding protein [Eubacterium sp. MSJ-21]|nr:ABC transporter ATP-binding protein [Eubacterium sp. MSJ-21]